MRSSVTSPCAANTVTGREPLATPPKEAVNVVLPLATPEATPSDTVAIPVLALIHTAARPAFVSRTSVETSFASA